MPAVRRYRIVERVRIGDVVYGIENVPQEELDAWGECKVGEARILLARELAPSQRRSKRRHEIGHGAFYESGAYEIAKGYTVDPDGLEEQILSAFIPVFCNALGVK